MEPEKEDYVIAPPSSKTYADWLAQMEQIEKVKMFRFWGKIQAHRGQKRYERLTEVRPGDYDGQ